MLITMNIIDLGHIILHNDKNAYLYTCIIFLETNSLNHVFIIMQIIYVRYI